MKSKCCIQWLGLGHAYDSHAFSFSYDEFVLLNYLSLSLDNFLF
uniref:Uncharacterized protein n=1 Tax=Anguilla anguilla TaxID=7936 RepID=A0A0E9UC01_ANGAN